MVTAISIILILFVLYSLWPKTPNYMKLKAFPPDWEAILIQKLEFYKRLNDDEKERFKKKLIDFLNKVRITGIETGISDELRILIASSAIIPVFYFENWHYYNLSEVLVYSGLVETYQIEERENKNKILGQVRPFQAKHILLLSKEALEKGFNNPKDRENVGIHEFTHLIDESDGQIDGLPKTLLPPSILQAWSGLMYKEIERIKKGKSDLNPYGITNEAEFFAVVCEYFFENPERFKNKHPELFNILNQAFYKK